jgi:hypothetical protein
VVEQPGQDWTPLPDLAHAEGRAERHRTIASVAGPGAPAQLPIVWEVEAIAWLIGVLVGGGLLRCAAYPDPDPRSVWVRMDSDGLPAGLALDASTTCRADGARGARATITRLLGPCLCAAGTRRTRVLWWHAGDRIADAMLWCGEAFAAQANARRLAAALLAAGVPYSVSLGADRDGESRTRRTCCLSRRTEGGVECEGCPHGRRESARAG